MSRSFVWLSLGLLVGSTPLPAADVATQFQAPPNAFAFDETAALEGYRQGYLQIRDSKMDVWVVQIRQDTTVKVEAEVEPSYLRPGLMVEFSGEVDDQFALAKPVGELELVAPKGRAPMGLFPDGDTDDDRPLRNPGAGTYRIKGKIAMLKDGQLTVAAGRARVTGELDPEAKIRFVSNDPGVAEFGDEVSVKAWYYQNTRPDPLKNQPGKAVAEEITITLSKPLSADSKRGRRTDRPVKATAKDSPEEE